MSLGVFINIMTLSPGCQVVRCCQVSPVPGVVRERFFVRESEIFLKANN